MMHEMLMSLKLRRQVRKFKKKLKEDGMEKEHIKLIISHLKKSIKVFKDAHFSYNLASSKHTPPERKEDLRKDLEQKKHKYERNVENIERLFL